MSSNISIPKTGQPFAIPHGETRRLTYADATKLQIAKNTGRSALPQFANDIFLASWNVHGFIDVTRMPDTLPPMGVAVTLNLNQVMALMIHGATMTSARPELADSKFAYSPAGRAGYIVTRLPADAEPAKAK